MQLQVRDETGAPLEGARVEWGEQSRVAGAGGAVTLDGLEGPVLAVVHAEGYLPEPLPVGREDAEAGVALRLWSARGGARWVMHSAGDVMFGRCYEAPTEGAPLVPVEQPGAGAQAVVEPVRRAFAAATVRTVNLETVVSDLPVPAASRRIGSAWRLFAEAEPRLSEPERALAWQSLVAVYPELQDWVARRGHGGAAVWHPTESPARIQELAGRVDVVMVQLHSGFQFQEAASANVRALARAAIDAGADIVVGHHPHILQGLEWYRERLITYSLGNFIFDQDFLVTFPSTFLRTVWEGNRLLEARLVPLELVDYRPVPVTEGSARRTLLQLWERSLLGAEADRDAQNAVRAFAMPPSPQTLPAQLALGEVERTLAVKPGAGWQTMELDLSDAMAVEGALPMNAVLLYLELTPPPRGEVALDVDDLEFRR